MRPAARAADAPGAPLGPKSRGATTGASFPCPGCRVVFSGASPAMPATRYRTGPMNDLLSVRTASKSAVAASVSAALSMGLVVVGLGFAWANRDLPIEEAVKDPSKWFATQNAFSGLVFLIPGWYLAVKAPRMLFGWMLLAGAYRTRPRRRGLGICHCLRGRRTPLSRPVAWPGPRRDGRRRRSTDTRGRPHLLPRWKTAGRLDRLGWRGMCRPRFNRRRHLLGRSAHGLRQRCKLPAGRSAQPDRDRLLRSVRLRRRALDGARRDRLGLGHTRPLVACEGRIQAATRLVTWSATSPESSLRRWVFLGGEWFMLSVQLPTILVLAALVAGSMRYRVYGIEVVMSRAVPLHDAADPGRRRLRIDCRARVLIAGDVSVAASFVAAAASAFVLAPARSRIERVINRLLFGERDQPYAVLSRMAAQLESAGSQENLLPKFAEQVAHALRVPFVAVEYGDGAEQHRVIYGEEIARPRALPVHPPGRERLVPCSLGTVPVNAPFQRRSARCSKTWPARRRPPSRI